MFYTPLTYSPRTAHAGGGRGRLQLGHGLARELERRPRLVTACLGVPLTVFIGTFCYLTEFSLMSERCDWLLDTDVTRE